MLHCYIVYFYIDVIQLVEQKFVYMVSRLEELHSLEYKRDADLFTDQEQRHKSQMELHQGHQDNLKTKISKSSNTLGKVHFV